MTTPCLRVASQYPHRLVCTRLGPVSSNRRQIITTYEYRTPSSGVVWYVPVCPSQCVPIMSPYLTCRSSTPSVRNIMVPPFHGAQGYPSTHKLIKTPDHPLVLGDESLFVLDTDRESILPNEPISLNRRLRLSPPLECHVPGGLE